MVGNFIYNIFISNDYTLKKTGYFVQFNASLFLLVAIIIAKFCI